MQLLLAICDKDFNYGIDYFWFIFVIFCKLWTIYHELDIAWLHFCPQAEVRKREEVQRLKEEEEAEQRRIEEKEQQEEEEAMKEVRLFVTCYLLPFCYLTLSLWCGCGNAFGHICLFVCPVHALFLWKP